MGAAQTGAQDYRNPKLPIDERVSNLLKQMTLEEKIDELAGGPGSWEAQVDAESKKTLEELGKLWRPEVEIPPREAARLRNAVQKIHVEKTRLGIPALFRGEALHGY